MAINTVVDRLEGCAVGKVVVDDIRFLGSLCDWEDTAHVLSLHRIVFG